MLEVLILLKLYTLWQTNLHFLSVSRLTTKWPFLDSIFVPPNKAQWMKETQNKRASGLKNSVMSKKLNEVETESSLKSKEIVKRQRCWRWRK